MLVRIVILFVVLVLAAGCLGKVAPEADSSPLGPQLLTAPWLENERWCVDHHNRSGCARNTNDGASCSCAEGHGPLINHLVAYVELDSYDRPTPSGVLVRDCAPSLLAQEANATINTNNGVSWSGNLFQTNLQSVPGSNGVAAYVNNFAPYVAVDISNPTAGFSGMQNRIIGGAYAEQYDQGGHAAWTLTCSGCFLDGSVIFGGQVPGIDNGSLTSLQPGVVKLLRNAGHEVYDFREPKRRFGNTSETSLALRNVRRCHRKRRAKLRAREERTRETP
jgi:hypothetical protein